MRSAGQGATYPPARPGKRAVRLPQGLPRAALWGAGLLGARLS